MSDTGERDETDVEPQLWPPVGQAKISRAPGQRTDADAESADADAGTGTAEADWSSGASRVTGGVSDAADDAPRLGAAVGYDPAPGSEPGGAPPQLWPPVGTVRSRASAPAPHEAERRARDTPADAATSTSPSERAPGEARPGEQDRAVVSPATETPTSAGRPGAAGSPGGAGSPGAAGSSGAGFSSPPAGARGADLPPPPAGARGADLPPPPAGARGADLPPPSGASSAEDLAADPHADLDATGLDGRARRAEADEPDPEQRAAAAAARLYSGPFMQRVRITGVIVAVMAAVGVHFVGLFARVELVITTPQGTSGLSFTSVVIVASIASLAAWLTAIVVATVTPRPRLVWTILAGIVVVVSFIPLFALPRSTAVLLLLEHMVVAIVLFVTFRITLPERA